MICNNCKHKLPDDSEFCQYCGSKVEEIKTIDDSVIDSDTLMKELTKPNITKEEAANLLLKYQAKVTVDTMEANMEHQPDNESDDDFGLVPEKPIFTLALKSVDGEEEYLNKLYTDSGEKITYSRRGSTSVEGVNGMIDIYDTFLPSGEPYKTIYINMYGAKSSNSAPKGFKFNSTTAITTKRINPAIENVHKSKKPINKKIWIPLTSIFSALVVILILLPTLIVPSIKYSHAKNLVEKGEYELAYSIFFELDGYSDSENMLSECRYLQAVKYRDAGDFNAANKIFESLGSYRDSKLLIHEHEYKLSIYVAATCATSGTETYKCKNCDDTYVKAITANHSYVLSSSSEATCQKDGHKTYKCSNCEDEYTEIVGKSSHTTVLVSTTDATCTSVGVKNYKCKNCNHTYSEEISIKPHNYSAATCTTAKTCGSCGKKEGTALGHTDNVICTRCNQSNFETMIISGTGEMFIRNFNIPKGEYLIIIENTSSYTVSIYINEDFIGYSDERYDVLKKKITASIVNGYLYIKPYQKTDTWTITIEAVGN